MEQKKEFYTHSERFENANIQTENSGAVVQITCLAVGKTNGHPLTDKGLPTKTISKTTLRLRHPHRKS